MDSPSLPPKRLSTWKRLAIISLFGGAGFALMGGILLGGVAWYTSRPTPPKPWNTAAIVAKEPPRFSISDDGKMIELTYVLENTSGSDYRIASLSELEVMARGNDGTLSGPFPDTVEHVRLPFFVPANQKAVFVLSVDAPSLPSRKSEESDADFHERLRKHLEEKYGALKGLCAFDSARRYQIDLPKWLAEKSKEQTP